MWVTSDSAYADRPPLERPCGNYLSASMPTGNEAWLKVDVNLNGWMTDPAAIVDYGAIPPTRMLIREARSWAMSLRYRCWPPPDAVVPDGDGGVSFEFHSGDVYRNLELLKNGTLWLTVFREGRIQSRRKLDDGHN